MKAKSYDAVIILLFAALACSLQALHGVLGVGSGFGMSIDLVAVPALIAFFLYGYRSSLAVLLLTAVFIALTEPSSWLGASMKLAATLPMISIPALYALFMERKFSLNRLWLNAFFALFIALLVFVVFEAVTAPPQKISGAMVIGPDGVLRTETQIQVGSLLLGLLPITAILLFAAWLILIWGKYSRKLSPMPFAQPRLLAEVLLVALFVRASGMLAAYYYYAGPVYFGAPPEGIMAAVPWHLVLGWNAAQGILEVLIAWLIAFPAGVARRYAAWW